MHIQNEKLLTVWQLIHRFLKAASYKWKRGGLHFELPLENNGLLDMAKVLYCNWPSTVPWNKLLQGFFTRLHIKYTHSDLTWLLTSWTVNLTPNFAKGQKKHKVWLPTLRYACKYVPPSQENMQTPATYMYWCRVMVKCRAASIIQHYRIITLYCPRIMNDNFFSHQVIKGNKKVNSCHVFLWFYINKSSWEEPENDLTS